MTYSHAFESVTELRKLAQNQRGGVLKTKKSGFLSNKFISKKGLWSVTAERPALVCAQPLSQARLAPFNGGCLISTNIRELLPPPSGADARFFGQFLLKSVLQVSEKRMQHMKF